MGLLAKTLHQYSINDLGNNYFGDGRLLGQGYFPQMSTLWMYDPFEDDENPFTDQCFPAKMQSSSLNYLCILSLIQQYALKSSDFIAVLREPSDKGCRMLR